MQRIAKITNVLNAKGRDRVVNRSHYLLRNNRIMRKLTKLKIQHLHKFTATDITWSIFTNLIKKKYKNLLNKRRDIKTLYHWRISKDHNRMKKNTKSLFKNQIQIHISNRPVLFRLTNNQDPLLKLNNFKIWSRENTTITFI